MLNIYLLNVSLNIDRFHAVQMRYAPVSKRSSKVQWFQIELFTLIRFSVCKIDFEPKTQQLFIRGAFGFALIRLCK